MPRAVSVLRQIPFSPSLGGVTYSAIQPVSWTEPTILERRYRPGVAPEEAVAEVAEFLHDDYAYVFEAYWDLWTPPEGDGEVGAGASTGPTDGAGVGVRGTGRGRDWTYSNRFRTRTRRSCMRKSRSRQRRSGTFAAMCKSWWSSRRTWKRIRARRAGCCGRSRKRIWHRS